MEETRVLNCPFCGSKAEIAVYYDFYRFHCVNPDCEAHLVDGIIVNGIGNWHGSIPEAREAWNTRTASGPDFSRAVHDGHLWRRMKPVAPEWEMTGETQTQEFWECSCAGCGHSFGVESREPFPLEMTVGKVKVPNFCPDCGVPLKEVGA